MSEQMREEFEAWAPIKHSHFLYPFNQIDGTDRYVHSEVQRDWAVWKASRASLPTQYTAVDMATAAADGFRDGAASVVVELPEDAPLLYELRRLVFLDDVVAAIKAAGGRAKE